MKRKYILTGKRRVPHANKAEHCEVHIIDSNVEALIELAVHQKYNTFFKNMEELDVPQDSLDFFK